MRVWRLPNSVDTPQGASCGAPEVPLLVPKVRIVVGQVVEGAQVQVADLNYPSKTVQRLCWRLPLSCTDKARQHSCVGTGAMVIFRE